MSMEIAITHLGSISQLIPATSIINGIRKKQVNTNITFVVANKDICYIGKYNKKINRTIPLNEFIQESREYDLLINLFPYFPKHVRFNPIIRHATGFFFDTYFDRFEGILSGKGKDKNMSLLQLYFILCGLTWKGEGYSVGYHPKTKTKKNKIGVSVANANLRNYVLDNLDVDNKRIWYIPYKKNIFKRMDEINKCKKIITDDLITFHLAMSMRKYVYYLQTFPLLTKLELFNSGEIHKIPINYLS